MSSATYRIGQGFDVHRFGAGDHIWLGGVRIPHDRGIIAHSDGDVALHALTDALLGAIGAGDIGDHFPPSDEKWRGQSSDFFLRFAVERLGEQGYRIGNIDLTIIAENPKIGAHRAAIRARLAELCEIAAEDCSIKATTHERMGAYGREEGLAALAIVLITKDKP